MFKTGFYEFATHEEVLLLGVVALILVLRNWWDLVRYGLARTATISTLAPKLSVARYVARLPRALRALRQNRRRLAMPRAVRPGHRPVRHAV